MREHENILTNDLLHLALLPLLSPEALTWQNILRHFLHIPTRVSFRVFLATRFPIAVPKMAPFQYNLRNTLMALSENKDPRRRLLQHQS